MSLNYKLTNIENWREVCLVNDNGDESSALNPVTQGLIFATMSVRLGNITDKNASEFFARLKIAEAINGEYAIVNDKPYYITADDVRAHIGLWTNVGNETRSAFLRSFNNLIDDTKRQFEIEGK